jgi:hypothetical protein
MLCYRDMTFCSASCANKECRRQFTAEDRLKAELWWRGCEGGPPVAFADFSANCEAYQPVTSSPSSSPSPRE